MQKKKRKQYTADFKAKIVKEMLREEKTVGQLASEYEVHSNMLYRWRDQALAGLPSLFSDQAAQELAEKEQEEVYLNDYATPREARQGLSTYLRYYHEERIHQSLDYRTPAEVYFQQ